MVFLFIAIFLGYFVLSSHGDFAISEELWEELLNHPERTFEITRDNVFGKGMSKKNAKRISSGALINPPEGTKNERPVLFEDVEAIRRSSLPDSYNIYDEFPECDTQPPQDQGTCGNCWIVSVINTASDRYCFQSARAGMPDAQNYTKYDASHQSLTSCYHHQSNSPPSEFSEDVCDGGYTNRAMRALFPTCNNDEGYHCGTVHKSCFEYGPYQSGNTLLACPKSPTSCPDDAIDGWDDWSSDRIFLSGYREYNEGPGLPMRNDPESIKEEIYTNGPVILQFFVYSDMYAYSSGVYTHIGGSGEGYHAVEVIGWGRFEDSQWWVVKNSWGTDFGMTVGNFGGYIYIKFGEVHIEDFPNAPEVIICNPMCSNGGVCVRQNDCDCDGTGYHGPGCLEPICSLGCMNGGICVEPEVCQCAEYFHGDQCEEYCSPVRDQSIFFPFSQ